MLVVSLSQSCSALAAYCGSALSARSPMDSKTESKPKSGITSMRLPSDLLAAATKKAALLDISRTRYFERLLRRDLGMEKISEAVNVLFG